MIELRPAAEPAPSDVLAETLVAERVAAGVPEPQARQQVTGFLSGTSIADGDVWAAYDVLRDGVAVGSAAYRRRRDSEVAVLALLHVPEQDRAPALREVASAAMEAGATSLALSAFPGAFDLTAAAQSLGAVHEATKMQLDLSAEPPSASVRLDEMTQEEYAAYQEVSTQEYADDLFTNGAYPDRQAALDEARRQTVALLPAGLDSPGQHFFVVRSAQQRVGLLWLFLEGEWSFIYDIRMEESARGQGFGTATLHEGARWARSRGATVLALNVFGTNEGARRLYERVGYATTDRFYRLDREHVTRD